MRHQPINLQMLMIAALLVVVLPLAGGVAWASVTVTPEMIETRIKSYIEETTPLDDPEATLYVDCVRLPFAPIVLEGEDVKYLIEDSRTNPLTTRTVLQLTLSTEAESRHIGVPIKMMVEKPVWVTKRLIRAKQGITAKDVMLQQKRLEFDAAYSLGSKDNISAYTSRVNLPPGSVLDVRNLTETPAVYRNDDVHLIMDIGNGVNVSVYGKALEDGTIGKRIRVSQRLPNGKRRVYMAEVVNRNTVMVKL